MVEQSTAASHALSTEAAELERLVSRFQVGAQIHELRQPAPVRPVARPTAAPTRESFRQRYVQGANALKVAPASRPGAWEEF
jgi:methyl-accepting chemotaxis protein